MTRNIFSALCSIVFYSGLSIAFGQGTWTQRASLPGPARYTAVGFTIGSLGYLGTGSDGGGDTDDFWEYDSGTDVWTQKANFGGGPRSFAVGFSIGTKGYIGTGGATNDFWEYDPALNLWVQKANVGGPPRTAAVGFSIGAKGYIGTGSNSGVALDDFWEYDPSSNTWIQIANYGGGPRAEIDRASFTIGNKAYVGLGQTSGGGTVNDFWEFDPLTNTWIQKANFPGVPRIGATGFSICGKGYLGLGANGSPPLSDFYMYDPGSNLWTSIAVFPGGDRIDQPAFVMNNKAYIITGASVFFLYNDLWEYIPGMPVLAVSGNSSSICAGQSATLAASGSNNYTWSTGATTSSIIVAPSTTSTYSVTAMDSCSGNMASVAVTVTVFPIPAPSISGNNTICQGDSTTLTASGGGVYSWSTGATSTSVIVSPTLSTSYSVVVSSGGGCTNTAAYPVMVIPGPIANAGSNVTINQGQTATLTATGGGTYSWNNGSMSASTEVNPDVTSVYCVNVMASNGCIDTACVTIFVIPCVEEEPYVPNAFSPNGDNENDVFQIYCTNKRCIREFTLVIYNRWGEKVFESNDFDKTWDGLFNGRPEGTGTFVYHFRTAFTSGTETTRTGNISLVK